MPAEAAREFSPPELTLCADSYSVSVPPPCYRSGTKRPRSFCQKCRWQVTPKHAYTLDPTKSEWAEYAAVQAYCGNLSGNELTRNSSGNTRTQCSQLAEPLWTDPCVKSGISVHLKKKKPRQGMNGGTFSQNPRKRGKKKHTTITLESKRTDRWQQ